MTGTIGNIGMEGAIVKKLFEAPQSITRTELLQLHKSIRLFEDQMGYNNDYFYSLIQLRTEVAMGFLEAGYRVSSQEDLDLLKSTLPEKIYQEIEKVYSSYKDVGSRVIIVDKKGETFNIRRGGPPILLDRTLNIENVWTIRKVKIINVVLSSLGNANITFLMVGGDGKNFTFPIVSEDFIKLKEKKGEDMDIAVQFFQDAKTVKAIDVGCKVFVCMAK